MFFMMSRSTWALSSAWSWRQIWHHNTAKLACYSCHIWSRCVLLGELLNSRWQKNWFAFFGWASWPYLRLQQSRWQQQKRKQQQSQQQLEFLPLMNWRMYVIRNGRRNVSNSRQAASMLNAWPIGSSTRVQDHRRRQERWIGRSLKLDMVIFALGTWMSSQTFEGQLDHCTVNAGGVLRDQKKVWRSWATRAKAGWN